MDIRTEDFQEDMIIRMVIRKITDILTGSVDYWNNSKIRIKFSHGHSHSSENDTPLNVRAAIIHVIGDLLQVNTNSVSFLILISRAAVSW